MELEVIPLTDRGLGNTSYLVGLPDRRAMVVDPGRYPAPYRQEAEGKAWKIALAVETHLHADFISGGRELANVGAQLLAPAGSELEFPHRPLEPEEEIDLGGLSLVARATPGHTPEHLSYLLSDGPDPVALFTGGSLLVGSVARTDLISPEETDDLTRRMFRSLHQIIDPLPDQLPVYPTHGAGSFCTVGGGDGVTTTLGAERRHNPFLQIQSEDAFVSTLLGGLGSYPRYYRHLRARNRHGPRVFGETLPPLRALSVDQVEDLRAQGAVVVDVRPATAWARGHLPHSLAIPLRDAFGSWLGWLVEIDAPLVFILDPGQDRPDLVRRCLAIGYEKLAGELAGSIEAWTSHGRQLATTPMAPISEVGDRLLVDVRQDSEWQKLHLPEALHVELGAVGAAQLPTVPLAVHCSHRDRAATAASLLEMGGRSDLMIITGGPQDWLGQRVDD